MKKGQIFTSQRLKKAIAFLTVFALLCSLLIMPVSGASKPDKTETVYGTGLLDETPESMAAFEKHAVRGFEKPKLNKLGLQRINEKKKAKGEPEVLSTIAVENDADLTEDTGISVDAGELPVFVDNSQLKYFPPIGNQGYLGSCASFCTTYYLATYMDALANDRDIKSSGSAFALSPSFTYNLVNDGSDSGSTLTENIEVLLDHGAPTIQDYPYDTANYRKWPTNSTIWRNAINNRFSQEGYITGLDTQSGLDTLKQYLNNGHILVFGTYVSSWNYTTTKDDPNTALDDSEVGRAVVSYVNGYSGGHGMTIVGYNDEIWTDINGNGQVDNGEKGALKIANSWGTSYKDGGFVWMAYDALRSTSIVDGGLFPNGRSGCIMHSAMAYWATARTSYTPKILAEVTVNTANRSQMGAVMGLSQAADANPITDIPAALSYDGGPYAFDGTTTACDATFVLDYTDLITANGFNPDLNPYKWYMSMADSSNLSSPLVFKNFGIVDVSKEVSQYANTGLPTVLDGMQYNSVILYGGGPTDTSLQVISSSPAEGDTAAPINKPITVNFNNNIILQNSTRAISLTDAAGNPVEVTKSVQANSLIIAPDILLNMSTAYTLTIPASEVANSYGNTLTADFILKFTTTAPRYPKVINTNPPQDSVNNPKPGKILIAFDEPVRLTSSNNPIRIYDSNQNQLSFDVGLSENVIILYPEQSWTSLTDYTVFIPKDAVVNAMGFNMAEDFYLRFRTANFEGPKVIQTEPGQYAKDVPMGQVFRITFDSLIYPGNYYTAIDVGMNNGYPAATFTKSIKENVLEITMTSSLRYSSNYNIRIPAGALVNDTRSENKEYNLFFTTGKDSAYLLQSITPVDGATAVPVNRSIDLIFSKQTGWGPYSNDVAIIDASGNRIGCSIGIGGQYVSIIPASNLAYGTKYTVTIPDGAFFCTSNGSWANGFTSSFTTVTAPTPTPTPTPTPADKVPPAVASTVPAANAADVSRSTTIAVTFNENVTAASNMPNAYIVMIGKNGRESRISASVSLSGNKLLIKPTYILSGSTLYKVYIPAGAVKDSAGNTNAAYSYQFKTARK